MRAIHNLSAVALLASLVGVAACDESDEKVFKSPGNTESKPMATMMDKVNGAADGLAASDEKPTVVASATYLVNVETETTSVCNGEFSGQIMSNFSFKLPEAMIQCAGLQLDIAAMLAGGLTGGLGTGGGAASGSGSPDLNNLVHDGRVLSMKSFLGATFDPPRPVLLGPIVQDAERYRDFKTTIETTLRGKLGEESYNKPGKFKIEVLEHKGTFTNDAIKDKEPLTNILHWKMEAEGFEGVPVMLGLPIPYFEFVWNTRPIMIPKVVVKGSLLKGLLKGDSAQVEKLAGTITITLIVKDYQLN